MAEIFSATGKSENTSVPSPTLIGRYFPHVDFRPENKTDGFGLRYPLGAGSILLRLQAAEAATGIESLSSVVSGLTGAGTLTSSDSGGIGSIEDDSLEFLQSYQSALQSAANNWAQQFSLPDFQVPQVVGITGFDNTLSELNDLVPIPDGVPYIKTTTPGYAQSGAFTWGESYSSSDFSDTLTFRFCACSTDGQTLLSGSTHTGSTQGRLYVSTDGGDSWSAKNPSSSTSWQNGSVSGDGSIMIAGGTANYWVSTDSGATWNSKSVGGATVGTRVCVVSKDGSTMYAAASRSGTYRVWVSTNNGDSWAETDLTDTAATYSITCSQDGTVACVGVRLTSSNLPAYYITTDSGTTWTLVEPSEFDTIGSGLLITCNTTGERMIAAEQSGTVFKSTDQGSTWTEDSNLPTATWEAIDGDDSLGRIVISGESVPSLGAAIYVSTDAGETWNADESGTNSLHYCGISGDGSVAMHTDNAAASSMITLRVGTATVSGGYWTGEWDLTPVRALGRTFLSKFTADDMLTVVGLGKSDSPQFAGMTLTGYLDIAEIAEPSDPAADTLRLYVIEDDNATVLQTVDETGLTFRVCQDSYRVVRNTSGSTITKGQVVNYTGSTGNKPNMGLAQGDDSTTMPAIGVVVSDILNNTLGTVMITGRLSGIDTSAFSEGDVLYVSSTVAGDFTNTSPVHPNFSQAIGTVEVSDAFIGAILVNVGPHLKGEESGTRLNNYTIGDQAAGAKTLTFDNGFLGVLSWDPTAARTLTLPDVTGTLITDAPSDGTTYGREDGAWVNSPTFTGVEIRGADARLVLADDNDPNNSYSEIDDSSPTQLKINKYAQTGAPVIDFNPSPLDGTSAAIFRFFRSTNTTGPVSFSMYKGDGTNTLHNLIGVNGVDTYFNGGGNFAVGTNSPETLFELAGAQPYITTHNDTHEDTDGGRESRWIAKGEQSGGEETTLGYMEFAHDGAVDDQKGLWRILLNAGSDADAPSVTSISGGSGGGVSIGTGTGELTCGSINRASGTLLFKVGGGQRFAFTSSSFVYGTNAQVFDSSDRMILGHTAAQSTGALGQSHCITKTGFAAFQMFGHANTADGSYIGLWKSRNTTKGSHTVVQNGDKLGGFFIGGSDGSAYQIAGDIRVLVDGTPAAGDVPGKIVLRTKASGGSLSDRLTIGNDGATDVVGDFTAGTIQADNGFTGTGSYTNFTIVGGIITSAS